MERVNKESKMDFSSKLHAYLSAYAQRYVEGLLRVAGIQLNGNNPYDPRVHDPSIYLKLIMDHELVLGEAYMDGLWDVEQLDEFFYKICRAGLERQIETHPLFLLAQLQTWLRNAVATMRNFQTKNRAHHVGEVAYDVGNDFFKKILDTRMNYTCGYWKNAQTLDDAQVAKLDLICRKLNLQPGQRVLDIGCGFGGFARYAAENYQAEVVGVTISKEQFKFAKEYCKSLPIDIRLQDYRDVNELFDHIVSIGMFEHVGYKNYRTFFKVVHRCLREEGLLVLQTIGSNFSTKRVNGWFGKYIFPNGMLPSIAQLGKASEKILMVEDWHSFGFDYDKTLMAWHENFIKNWGSLKTDYNERFYRLWNFYLLSCAGAFRARDLQLWQIVFSKHGMMPNYHSIR